MLSDFFLSIIAALNVSFFLLGSIFGVPQLGYQGFFSLLIGAAMSASHI